MLDTMRLANGLPWALPVCLAVETAPSGDRVALADESGKLVAVLDVGETLRVRREREAEQLHSARPTMRIPASRGCTSRSRCTSRDA